MTNGETGSRTLTRQQRSVLERARDAINRTPGAYDQLTYGSGNISCTTPACIAGMIVGTDPELQGKVRDRMLSGTGPGKEDGSTRAAAIRKTAAEALELSGPPLLFHTEWPTSWLRHVGMPTDLLGWRDHGGSFLPDAQHAIAVLDGILDGRIEGAL